MVGQWHDLGALSIALTAAEQVWQAIYYGPNLPAEEIAAGVKKSGARVVAISITHLLDHHALGEEFRKLRRYIGKDTALFVGGRAVESQIQISDEVNAKYVGDIGRFSEDLNALLVAKTG